MQQEDVMMNSEFWVLNRLVKELSDQIDLMEEIMKLQEDMLKKNLVTLGIHEGLEMQLQEENERLIRALGIRPSG